MSNKKTEKNAKSPNQRRDYITERKQVFNKKNSGLKKNFINVEIPKLDILKML